MKTFEIAVAGRLTVAGDSAKEIEAAEQALQEKLSRIGGELVGAVTGAGAEVTAAVLTVNPAQGHHASGGSVRVALAAPEPAVAESAGPASGGTATEGGQ